MVRRICEITVALYFMFRLVPCSREDVLFNIIYLNVLEGIKQLFLSISFKKYRLETPSKDDNVKTLIRASNCENLVFYFSKKVQQTVALDMLY